jgi:hypothetical protein
VLLPELGASTGLGSQADAIVSLGNDKVLVHFNESIADNRDHHLELWSSVIFEAGWNMRLHPVAEVFVDRVVGGSSEYSGLLGGVWRFRESLFFDVAGRAARAAGSPAWEVRLGLSWTTRVWAGEAPSRADGPEVVR